MRWRSFTFLCLWLLAPAQGQAQQSRSPASSSGPTELARLIESLERLAPFPQPDIERALGVKLMPNGEGVDGDVVGVGPNLGGDLSIAKIDLRRRQQDDGSVSAFLVISVAGGCVSLADVAHELKLASAATGLDIPHEGPAQLFASSARPWGKLLVWFSFPAPSCLETITFQPAKTDRRQ